MNSTKPVQVLRESIQVWEICKFWILQNKQIAGLATGIVWELCKSWILQNKQIAGLATGIVWEICKFWILQNSNWFIKEY